MPMDPRQLARLLGLIPDEEPEPTDVEPIEAVERNPQPVTVNVNAAPQPPVQQLPQPGMGGITAEMLARAQGLLGPQQSPPAPLGGDGARQAGVSTPAPQNPSQNVQMEVGEARPVGPQIEVGSVTTPPDQFDGGQPAAMMKASNTMRTPPLDSNGVPVMRPTDLPADIEIPQPPPPAPPAAPPAPETEEQRRQREVDEELAKVPPAIPTGNSSEDQLYGAEANISRSYLLARRAVAEKLVLDREEAKRTATATDSHAAEFDSLSKDRAATLDYWQEQHRRFWDDARRAQAEANARFPNPDDLLGGKGSWSRALALGIAAVAGGIGAPHLANVINQQMQLQMAGRQANYNKLSERSKDLLGDAGLALKSMEVSDAGFVGRMADAQTRYANELKRIAASIADPRARQTYLEAAAALEQKTAEERMKLATLLTNKELKEQQLAIAAAKAAAKGGGGGGAVNYNNDDLEKLPKDQRKRAVRIPGGGFFLAGNEELAKEANRAFEGSRQLVTGIDAVLVLQDSIPGFREKLAGKMGWEDGDMATIKAKLAALLPAAKNAYKLGTLDQGVVTFMENFGANPSGVNDLFKEIVPKLHSWRESVGVSIQETINQYATTTGHKANIGSAPEQPKAKTVDEYINIITATPAPKKGGGMDATVRGSSRVDLLKAADQRRQEDGVSDGEWKLKLELMKASIESRKQLIASAQLQAEKDLRKKLKKKPGEELPYEVIQSYRIAMASMETLLAEINGRIKAGGKPFPKDRGGGGGSGTSGTTTTKKKDPPPMPPMGGA